MEKYGLCSHGRRRRGGRILLPTFPSLLGPLQGQRVDELRTYLVVEWLFRVTAIQGFDLFYTPIRSTWTITISNSPSYFQLLPHPLTRIDTFRFHRNHVRTKSACEILPSGL